MEPTYVFGHRNPDTDSVVAAMAYASLYNALGEGNYIPARLGHLNDETAFLLKHFGFEAPLYLRTVRTQVLDIDYDRPPILGQGVSVGHAWRTLQENAGLSAIPVTGEDGTLYGMLTAGQIAEHDMDSLNDPRLDNVPLFNLLSALEGNIINRDDDVFDAISGRLMIALSTDPEGAAPNFSGAVVICGHQP